MSVLGMFVGTPDMNSAALEELLHHQIPLTRALEVAVRHSDQSTVILTAPLAANRNHKSTAFGGSLYSVAVLAGWGLVRTKLEHSGHEAHVVIARSEVDYLCPVRGDFEATCQLSDSQPWERALRSLQRHGRGRITLEVVVTCQGQDAVRFRGDYAIVAHAE